MPIYEYRCKKCEKLTEAMQKMGARPLRKCPHCGGALEKIVSRVGFQLKGGGWFSEGYSSSGKSGKSESPSSAKSSAKDSKKGSGKKRATSR